MVQDNAELFTVGPYDVIMPIVILSSWVLVIVAVWLVLKTDTSATNKILCCIAIFALPVIPAVAFIYLYYKSTGIKAIRPDPTCRLISDPAGQPVAAKVVRYINKH